MAEKRPRILLVDDDERNLRLLEAMLVPLGYDVHKAGDGEEGIMKAKEVSPDVILLDIMMPKLDGFMVAKQIKGDPTLGRIPIVMVTALGDSADRVRALEAGADDFLTKPVDKSELTARVKSLVKVKAYSDHLLNYQRELEEEVTRRTAELSKALGRIKSASLDTVYRLSRAAEYKDEDTGTHIQRMSRYTACVAATMGLSKAEVEVLLYAAPLHDIGKIGIPDKILLKPGKLTEEEWRIMRTHTSIGSWILENSDTEFIKVGAKIALSHHEKWDGTGYPEGLKGDQIPLAARISAIGDVFDALTSRRPYRQRIYTDEEAFAIIKEGNGIYFDPRVYEAFEACWNEIREIKNQNTDTHFQSRYFDVYQSVESLKE